MQVNWEPALITRTHLKRSFKVKKCQSTDCLIFSKVAVQAGQEKLEGERPGDMSCLGHAEGKSHPDEKVSSHACR